MYHILFLLCSESWSGMHFDNIQSKSKCNSNSQTMIVRAEMCMRGGSTSWTQEVRDQRIKRKRTRVIKHPPLGRDANKRETGKLHGWQTPFSSLLLFLRKARCENVACCSRCSQQKKKDMTFVNLKGRSRWESELNVYNQVKSYPIAIKSQKHILLPGLKGVLHNQL